MTRRNWHAKPKSWKYSMYETWKEFTDREANHLLNSFVGRIDGYGGEIYKSGDHYAYRFRNNPPFDPLVWRDTPDMCRSMCERKGIDPDIQFQKDTKHEK